MDINTHQSSDFEIAVEELDAEFDAEFDSEKLPSLDDLMRELSEADKSSLSQPQPVKPSVSAAATVNPAMVAELSEAKRVLKQAETEKQEIAAAFERVTADFEKYRWRTERERGEHYSFAVISIVRDLLPILDNFERALASVNYSLEETGFSQFVGGVELIYQQAIKFLADLGVHPVATTGAPFDPRVHEAIATESRDDVAANTVVEEILRGYQIGEKLIRPAMVKVSVNGE